MNNTENKDNNYTAKHDIDVENLVFSGGNLKGIIYAGCIAALEDYDLIPKIKRVSATSVGSLFAFGMLLGYTSIQIKELVHKINLHFLKDISADNILGFPINFGIDSGNKIENVLRILIKKKGYLPEITFEQFYERVGVEFIVVGSCISQERKKTFSYKETPDFEIVRAIRISCGLPFLYNTVKIDDDVYGDGCLFENTPISYFTSTEEMLNKTIAFNINAKTIQYEHNISNYVLKLYNCMANTISNLQLEKYQEYLIDLTEIDLKSALDITTEEKEKLIDYGYRATKEHIIKRYINIEVQNDHMSLGNSIVVDDNNDNDNDNGVTDNDVTDNDVTDNISNSISKNLEFRNVVKDSVGESMDKIVTLLEKPLTQLNISNSISKNDKFEKQFDSEISKSRDDFDFALDFEKVRKSSGEIIDSSGTSPVDVMETIISKSKYSNINNNSNNSNSTGNSTGNSINPIKNINNLTGFSKLTEQINDILSDLR
jgi:NTE family protein